MRYDARAASFDNRSLKPGAEDSALEHRIDGDDPTGRPGRRGREQVIEDGDRFGDLPPHGVGAGTDERELDHAIARAEFRNGPIDGPGRIVDAARIGALNGDGIEAQCRARMLGRLSQCGAECGRGRFEVAPSRDA